ncbi:MAG: P-loop domain-containing protein, partial [Candidatus Bipolaricaulia bacterium]
LVHRNLDPAKIKRHVETVEDADFIRENLLERGLVAFVAEGAVLPRESGVSQRPMEGAIPFRSPRSLRAEFELPNRGRITGMGIPEGVTLLVGGGYHGKSTLLDALAEGVYDHIPGDGREFVVTRADAVNVRAEDGRFIEKVDISPFIGDLPLGIATREFSTKDASGSTSQAANIIEALEIGAKVLLIDEDTSATNFLIRDERMRRLIAAGEEPITPLVDKVRPLYREHGVSTVMIMGGSGEFFGVADTVIKLREFVPYDVTVQAKELAAPPVGSDAQFGSLNGRSPLPGSIDPRKGKKVKIKVRDRRIQFGREEIDLSAVEQLVEPAQVHTIGNALHYLAKRYFNGQVTLAEALARLEGLIEQEGLLAILPYESGQFSWVRRFEIAAALNRLRSLRAS